MTAPRRVFVGDIQGCRAQLEELLRAVDFTRGRDVLHPVGDLVNKGPDSPGTLRLLREIGAQAVQGNHDRIWLECHADADPELRRWLAAQPIVRDLGDILMVHAGVHPAWDVDTLATRALTEAEIEFATTVRYCATDGAAPPFDWPPPGPPFAPWDSFYRGRKTIVFGHWARRGLVRGERAVGLDTGCVYGGSLTAWIAETDQIVQVPGLPDGPRSRRRAQ